MTNSEILDKIYPGCDCIEAYKARGLVDPGCARCNTIDFTLEAMEEARKDEAVEFAQWLAKNSYREWNRNVWFRYNGDKRTETYTTEELYQLFKQSKQ